MEKKSVASNESFRKYSYPVSRNWFEPDLVETLIAAPGERPYSAEYGLVTTLNSWIASTDGRDTCVVSSCTFSEMLLLSTPSSRKLFWSARAPCTLMPPVRPNDVPPPWSEYRSPCTPGTSASRS